MSDFITETIGRLKLNQQQIDKFGDSIPHEARIMINPGKNYDGWWNIDKLIEQVIFQFISI